MNISCMPCRAHQRAIHTSGNRHITDICQRTDFQSIKGSLIKRLVTCNSSDSQQVNVRMVGCEQNGNGIIMARVTVKNNFVFHLFYLYTTAKIVPTKNSYHRATGLIMLLYGSMQRHSFQANRATPIVILSAAKDLLSACFWWSDIRSARYCHPERSEGSLLAPTQLTQ